MPRFSEGDTVWTEDPLNGGIGAFEVLDVLEDFDEEYTEHFLLLAPPGDGDGEKSFCVCDDRAFHTKEEAELCSRRRRRAKAGGKAMTDLLFKVVYYVPGVGRMECAVRESQLVTMFSALIESGFHIQSASIWYDKKTEAA